MLLEFLAVIVSSDTRRKVSPYPAASDMPEGLTATGETPALPMVREKPVTTSIATATTRGMPFVGIIKSNKAPRIDPMSVRPMRAGSRFRGIIRPFRNGSVPPKLKKMRLNMLVATAT